MKAENLIYLSEHKFNVPKFVVIDDSTEIDKIDLDFTSKFAVRSSFDVEDNAENSYAGQFETLLNVDRANVKAAVAKVKSSYRNAELYNLAEDSNEKLNASAKIIVQEMIDADYSGVAFTSNPVGILNEIVIVVGKGLGCNVVEDKIDTTSYYYHKDDEVYYYETNNDSPILEESIFKQIISSAKQIEELFKKPTDIEFCVKNNKVYILQARPITTLQLKSPIILDNSNIVESYPGISLPLTQSFAKDIYYKIFKYCVLHLTEDEQLVNRLDNNLRDMVDIANNRIYYRISNWYSVLNLLPFSSKIIGVWQEMLGVQNEEVVLQGEKVKLKTKLNIVKQFVRYLKNTPKLMDELNTYFEGRIEALRDEVDKADNVQELIQIFDCIEEEIVQRWDITLVNDMYTFIYTHLAGKKQQPKISNIAGIESMKPVSALNELKEVANQAGMDSELYLKKKKEYIESYGDRVLHELKLETPTYRTNPEMLDEYIKSSADSSGVESKIDIDTSDSKKYASCDVNSKANIDTSDSIKYADCDVNSNIDRENIEIDFKTEDEIASAVTQEMSSIKDGEFVKRAKIGIKNREISRMNRTRLFGLTRTIFLKIGKDYVEQGRLNDKTDIFYFTISEIKEDKVCKKFLEKKKMSIKQSEEVPEYSRLVFDKEIIDKKIVNATNNKFDSKALYGLGTSLGIVEGEIFVVDDILEINHIPEGKILVTKTTDPGWVLLIKNAKGVIAEKGSLLSHTAIVTRELNKPSIVNVRNATTILKTGMYVKLDANNGKIEVIDNVESKNSKIG